MKSINPANEQLIKEYQCLSQQEILNIIDDTQQCYLLWKESSFQTRSRLMFQLASVLRKNKQKYAETISLEMGKPISESKAEVEKSAWVCEYYAENAAQMLQDEVLESDASSSFVAPEPLGIVLAIMPWNFPFWQVFRFAAPAIMAGNAALLKHASNVMGCAQIIEESFMMAGFPKTLFSNLTISSSQVAEVIKHKNVKACSLTGSEYAGSEVAATSGKVLKKTLLELGGSDAFIVLDDADLKEAAKWGVLSRMLNNGQSCIAAKRFILHEKIADQYIKLLNQELDLWKIGDPLSEETKIGPLARKDLKDDLETQIADALYKGAQLIRGGNAIEGKGYFFEPTIIQNITKEMKLYTEESFGPVFALYIVKNEEEAIQLANNSEFGLGGSIWTQNIEKGVALARRVETGAMFVNGMTKSDPRLPFGGIKKSGYGRELSYYGIKEFVNLKCIWVK